MVPSKDITIFIKNNYTELCKITHFLCNQFNFPHYLREDFIQKIILKIITYNLLERYDENYTREKIKISTYLCKVILNDIKMELKSADIKFYKSIIYSNGYDSKDIRVEYKTILYRNIASDNVIGLRNEFDTFERYLSRSPFNKTFKLKRRGHRIETLQFLINLEMLKKNGGIAQEYDLIRNTLIYSSADGCTLLDIFHLLYRGYTNVEIAQIYGVSKASVFSMRQRLLKVMLKFGLFELRNN